MDSLADFPLLAGLTEEQVERFNAQCVWKNYEPDELIIDHHESSTDVRFIVQGNVRIVVRMVEGREVILNDYGAGQFFGELAAIDGGLRSANVTATVKTRLCFMPQSVFQAICFESPDVSWAMMNHLVGHVRRLSNRLAEFSFLKAKHRLYAELLRLSRPRSGRRDQRIISPALPQAEIADRISSRREIVSREMKALERRGILERSRGGLVICEPQQLKRLAAEGWTS
ncbi:MAG: Crp/Fnr family transcriptional regulator [Ahrensia sp.]|nr:Crp/Fnr family transcriptional regulator [Ahrensia sp.]